MNRSIQYVSLINAGMILFLLLSRLKEVGVINFEIDKYLIFIYIGGILAAIIVGFIEIKLIRGYSEENIVAFRLNPYLMEMLTKTREIHSKLNLDKKDNECV